MLARGDAVADKKRRSRWQEETLSLARGDALLSREDVVTGRRRHSHRPKEMQLLAKGDLKMTETHMS